MEEKNKQHFNKLISKISSRDTWLAQLVERVTFDLQVVDSSTMLGAEIT